MGKKLFLFFLILALSFVKAQSTLPISKSFDSSRILAKGSDNQIVVWIQPRFEELQKTLETFPKVNCIEFAFLVQNMKNNSFIIRPQKSMIIYKDKTTEEIFPGERWKDIKTGKPGKYVHLGPSILEVNNEDVSLFDLDSVKIRKDDYSVYKVSFVVGKEDTYESFIEKIKGFIVVVEPLKGKSFNLIVNVL